MADEPEQEKVEEPVDAGASEAAAEAPEAPEAVAEAPEPPAETSEPVAEAPEPPAEEASAEEPAGDAAAEEEAPQAAPAAAAAPAGDRPEELSSKERRRKARSQHVGEPRPPRTAEERHAERASERRTKALRRRARRLQERAKRVERAKSSPRVDSGELAPVHAAVEGVRRVRQGIVVSDKAEKTITVRIDVARRHPRYEKIVRSSNTLHAHDENNDAHEGDVVRVIESRPLSRTKRWALVDVLERAR
jgi:small subunit ribosomal protein S17